MFVHLFHPGNMAEEVEQEQDFNLEGDPESDVLGDEGFVGENETSHDGETGEANNDADGVEDPVGVW